MSGRLIFPDSSGPIFLGKKGNFDLCKTIEVHKYWITFNLKEKQELKRNASWLSCQLLHLLYKGAYQQHHIQYQEADFLLEQFLFFNFSNNLHSMYLVLQTK